MTMHNKLWNYRSIPLEINYNEISILVFYLTQLLNTFLKNMLRKAIVQWMPMYYFYEMSLRILKATLEERNIMQERINDLILSVSLWIEVLAVQGSQSHGWKKGWKYSALNCIFPC